MCARAALVNNHNDPHRAPGSDSLQAQYQVTLRPGITLIVARHTKQDQ
jgi:hypothetical protein